MLKFDMDSIDFDYIDVQDAKYLPSSFNNEILFVLPSVAIGVPNAYGCSVDDMDKICDMHPWCTAKITNIQNDFGFSFTCSTCASKLQFLDNYCDDIHCNAGIHNNNKWVESTSIPFYVGGVGLDKSKLECKVCRLTPQCIVLCHPRIMYVHLTSSLMFGVCIHLGVHDHPISNGICRE